MSLEKTIMEEIKAAMRAKDKIALDALRSVKSAILYAKTEGKDKELSESEEIAIIQKQVKMRKDASEQFITQDRPEMAENELKQIIAVIQKEGASSMKDMGRVVSIANQKLAGKAESKKIAEEVKKQLNP